MRIRNTDSQQVVISVHNTVKMGIKPATAKYIIYRI